MPSNWQVVGQVGKVERKGQMWYVTVADNRYEGDVKVGTVWFHLLCKFEPKVKTGDRVIAMGVYDRSRNEGFQQAMICKHVGKINGNGRPLEGETLGHDANCDGDAQNVGRTPQMNGLASKNSEEGGV